MYSMATYVSSKHGVKSGALTTENGPYNERQKFAY